MGDLDRDGLDGDDRDDDALVDALAGPRSWPDLTRLLLRVLTRRAADRTAAQVVAQARSDRFVQPDGHPFAALRAVQDELVAALGDAAEWVTLAPLIPFAAHAVMAGVAQGRVLGTQRAVEVAADPTNGLALEIALRRTPAARPGPGSRTRLATLQRVTRAQLPPDPRFAAHFELFAQVSGGRDPGGWRFHHEELAHHLALFARFAAARGEHQAHVALTPLSAAGEHLAEALLRAAGPPLALRIDRDRATGRNYYEHLCFKFHLDAPGGPVEVGDGGFVPWLARLTGDRRERLLISALATGRIVDVDRLRSPDAADAPGPHAPESRQRPTR